MSIWTYKTTGLAAFLALAACDLPFVSRQAPTSVQLADGLVVAGAKGWCVDESTSQTAGETAVVVLGNCAALSGNPDEPQPDVAGIVTVSVEATGTQIPSADDLVGFLLTESGRAALARNGDPNSVEILETETDGGTVFLHAQDISGVPSGAAKDYWRALFGMEGRFVSVSLVAPNKSPIGRNDGLATLDAHIARLISANGK